MKNVFITGVSSGLGWGLATECLQRGDQVFGISRRSPGDLLPHERLQFAAQDLTEFDSLTETVGSLLPEHTSLDLVILNAGILGEIADMRDTSLDQLRHLMDTNVWANKVILDTILRPPRHVRQVVAISSGAAVNGNRGWGGYSISKAALNMLTLLYARENPDTHLSALAPGLVDTAMQDYLCSRPADPRFESLENLKSRRHTAEMPGPQAAAVRLMEVITRLPSLVESGQFVDVRQLP